ncbi:hypothetical protein ACWC9U_32240 [Streptomyces sp. 900116325]
MLDVEVLAVIERDALLVRMTAATLCLGIAPCLGDAELVTFAGVVFPSLPQQPEGDYGAFICRSFHQ